MSWGPIVFVAALVILGVVWLVSRQLLAGGLPGVGQAAPSAEGIPGQGTVVLFFHSPHCGPCRSMEPFIAPLVDEGWVRSIDVQQHPDLARAYGVRGTPTTVRVHDGVVEQAEVGFIGPDKVQALVAGR